MTGMRGNGRGRRNLTQRSARAQMNMLKSSLHGHPNQLRHLAPPAVNKRPFNNLVVSHVLPDAGVEYTIGPTEVVTYLKNQLGLQDQTKTIIVFKLRRIDLFAVPIGSSSDRPSCNMIVSALNPTLGDPATPGNAIVSYGNLYSGNDVGSLQDCAKLSYTFPLHMADVPLSTTAGFHFLEVASNQANAELRFHLSWSTIDIASPVA